MDKGIHILHLIFAFRYLKQYQPSACGIYKWYLWRGFQWIVVVAPFVFDNGSLSCIGRCQVHVCFIDRFIFFFKNIEILDKMCKWFLRQFYVNNKFCEQTKNSLWGWGWSRRLISTAIVFISYFGRAEPSLIGRKHIQSIH